MPHVDPVKRREYARQHYLQNREKKLKQAKEWGAKNPEKRRKYVAKHYQKHKEERRHRDIKRLYGLSKEEYEAMLKRQNYTCAICFSASDKWNVDHDHATGAVRGILCSHCNWMLGHAKDNTTVLASAINYLKEHGRHISDKTPTLH